MKLYWWITNLSMGVLALVGSSTALAANVYHTLNLGEPETYSHVRDYDDVFTDTGIFTLEAETEVIVTIVDTEVISQNPGTVLLDVSSFQVYSGSQELLNVDGLASEILRLGTLGPGDHTLTFQGVPDGVWGGIYDVTVSVVPLPGAAWLIGSALFGFAVYSSRQSV
jgi:hypothetical protein